MVRSVLYVEGQSWEIMQAGLAQAAVQASHLGALTKVTCELHGLDDIHCTTTLALPVGLVAFWVDLQGLS